MQNHCTAKFDPSEFMKNIAQSVEIRSRLGKSTIEKLDEECAKKMEKNKGVSLSIYGVKE
jgi:hypothetical protein